MSRRVEIKPRHRFRMKGSVSANRRTDDCVSSRAVVSWAPPETPASLREAQAQAWRFMVQRPEIDTPHAAPAEHRPQKRDLYVPAGDTGFWQGAVRAPDDPFREGLPEAFQAGGVLTVDLLYGDHEGGQLTISRFILTREEDGHWLPGIVRHWPLEAIDPRGR